MVLFFFFKNQSFLINFAIFLTQSFEEGRFSTSTVVILKKKRKKNKGNILKYNEINKIIMYFFLLVNKETSLVVMIHLVQQNQAFEDVHQQQFSLVIQILNRIAQKMK